MQRIGCIIPALVAGVAGLASVGGGVHAADITGRVVLRVRADGAAQQAAANPYAGSLGNLPICGLPKLGPDNVRDVVLWLPEAPVSSGAAASMRAEIRQVHQSFLPRVLAVAAGATVDFPNDDPIFHNAFSYSKAKRFDLGKYGKGKSASVTFDKPGIVQVFCDIHASMSAYVVVTPNALMARPAADGSFVLRDVPPGKHVLEIWHPDRGGERRSIDVPAAGLQLEITL
jgi:plastocyanin